MKTKELYTQPKLTVVRFQVERGFDASNAPASIGLHQDELPMESFDFRSGWSDESDGNSNTFWD